MVGIRGGGVEPNGWGSALVGSVGIDDVPTSSVGPSISAPAVRSTLIREAVPAKARQIPVS
jgi:hypothetical protein